MPSLLLSTSTIDGWLRKFLIHVGARERINFLFLNCPNSLEWVESAIWFTNMDGSTSHGSSTSQTTTELTHKRGHTSAERTRKRPSTVEIPTINLNSQGQVIGHHYTEFIIFLGTIVRTPTIVPLNYDDWRSVLMYYKEEAWKEIEKYFKFDGDGKRYILINLGYMWSDYKQTLRKKTIESFQNIRNAPRPMFPVEIPEDQWKHLIDRWSSPEFLVKLEKNKECRKKQKLPHTAGRTSFPQTIHLMSLEMPEGRQPSRVELFKKTHKRKNGSYIDHDSMEVMEKLEQKLDEQLPDLRNDKSVQDDVFLQVMGPERNGRVRGAGKAVAPSDVGLARSNVQKKKEDEELQATISNM